MNLQQCGYECECQCVLISDNAAFLPLGFLVARLPTEFLYFTIYETVLVLGFRLFVQLQKVVAELQSRLETRVQSPTVTSDSFSHRQISLKSTLPLCSALSIAKAAQHGTSGMY